MAVGRVQNPIICMTGGWRGPGGSMFDATERGTTRVYVGVTAADHQEDPMSEPLDARSQELLEATNFAHVATIRRDGSPHVTPVWVDLREGMVWLNSAEGRAWPTNLKRDPRVTLNVQNLENTQEFVEIRGLVSQITRDGADEHIDFLAKKYLGEDSYPYRQPGENRVIIKILPEWARRQG
jgi:PPOX class probable F420-dependent enzyme